MPADSWRCQTALQDHEAHAPAIIQNAQATYLTESGGSGVWVLFSQGAHPLSLTSSCSKDLTPSLAPPAAPQPLDHRASFPSFLMPSSCAQLPHASSSRYFAQRSPSRHSPGGRDATFAPSPHPDLLPFLTSSVKGPGHRDS